MLAVGGVLYAAGVALMAQSTSGSAFALTGGVLLGLGLAGGSFTIVLAAFARLVPEDKRSWSMGLATAAGSLGQFLFAPLGQAFISSYGPVTALLLLACFVAVVPLLASALTGRGAGDAEPEPEVSVRDAIRGAMRHPSYLMLTAGFFVCGFHIAFITTHLPPYLTDNGLSAGLAAWSLSLVGLFNVIGAYTAGVLGGFQSRRLLLSGIYFSRGVAVHPLRARACHPGRRARLLGRDGAAVALYRAADVRARGAHVRHPPRRDAVRLRLPLPPDRRLHRRLARRRRLRGDGLLRPDVVAVRRAGVRRRRGPPPDLGAPRPGSGTLSRMRVRSHVAIVLALSAAAFGSAYWQASVAPADSEAGQTARFVCPLH